MSPHESKYTKTRNGYILAFEEMIEMELPLAYHRLTIEQAFKLWESTKLWEFPGLQNDAGKMGLPLIAKQIELPLEESNHDDKKKKSI